MPFLGYHVNENETAAAYSIVGTADSLNQRAYATSRMTQHGWATRLHFRGGRRTGTVPRVRLAIWSVGSGAAPSLLLGLTDEFTMGTYMLDASDGTEYVVDLDAVVKLQSNNRYAPGFVASDAPIGYGTLVNVPSGEYNDEYRRTVASGPTPQDPFAHTSSGDAGWIAVAIEYETNVAPDAPSNRLPVNNAASATYTPTFEGDFTDDNTLTAGTAIEGEYMSRVKVRVNSVVDGYLVVHWQLDRATTAAERAANRFSVLYDGPALVAGAAPEYGWEAQVADAFGTYGPWSAENRFTVGNGVVTTTAGTPTGKQETRTPSPFTAVWTHDGALTTDDMTIRIRDADTGNIVGTSGTITLGAAVAHNGTISITWAQTLFSSTMLQWGGDYTWEMRARDSANNWSSYSTPRAFTVNAAPSVPTLLSPGHGETNSARPLLKATTTDLDDSNAGITVTFQIYNSSGTLLQTRVGTYAGIINGTPTWQYQTLAADLATTGDYRWDAYAHDGTVYSGPQTAVPGGTPDERVFTYAAGPDITMTGPPDAQPIASNTPLYDWSVSDQVRFRVHVWQIDEDDDQVDIYDSGEIQSSFEAHRQIEGYLENLNTYYWNVEVWNSLNQRGVSPTWSFTVDYGEIPILGNFTASPYRADGDVTHTAVLLSWDSSTYSQDQHREYIIMRQALPGQLLDIDDDFGTKKIRVKRISSKSETTWVDYLPASGVAYVYGVRQIVELDGLALSSDYTKQEVSVAFKETVICDARNGGARRAVFVAREDRQIERRRDQKEVTPWSSSKPTVIRTDRWSRVITTTFVIGEDLSFINDEETVRAIDLMDRDGGPLCYRDGRGRRMFGEITAFSENDTPGGDYRRVDITMTQTSAGEVFDLTP